MGTDASRANAAFYGRAAAGRRDYWRKMAAPRHRAYTLTAELRRDHPQSVVDIGCGDGAMLDEVAVALPAAARAGIDLSQVQIELNRQAQPSVQWVVRDLDGEVAFDETLAGRFDAVVACEVIEHVDHPEALLTNALALAAPNGRLYLSTQSGPLRETERRVGHRRHFSADEMRALLERTGWNTVNVWNTGFPFHDLSKWYANRDPDGSMERFGGDSYGLAENLICWGLRQAFRLNSRRRGAQLFAVGARR